MNKMKSLTLEHLKNLLSFGNTKLPKSTAIFNLGSATFCPSKALGLCAVSDICYAMKSEVQYKQVLPYRTRQLKYFNTVDSLTFVNQFLDTISRKKVKVTHLRLNESGDFGNQYQVDKFTEIAKLLQAHNIKVYTYTANDTLNFKHLMKYCVVNGSNIKYSNRFKAVLNYSNDNLHCVGDCSICNICSINLNATIEVLKH